ncbi:hypothetical protein J2T60_002056 [Natronospira proteinivora]|uniref:Uncharacterized protein n=1 Tax=Natronospira proteinivora TaxID=1807133 RepID=A0ABT1G9W9_9GAMM|nr:hypothetical protein [Natronospira proteinivora]MCP1728056.1 hypothetical protein [Natronospira proteinivora]
MKSILAVTIFLLIFSTSSYAKGEVVQLASTDCQSGLHEHPEGSDFSVFVFCDDALGTQIGIILTRPAAGPVETDTDWSLGNRFWQEGAWMTDVKQMVWSKSGDFLYVTTSQVYSDESFYKIDLVDREACKLISGRELGESVYINRVEEGAIFVNGHEFKMK